MSKKILLLVLLCGASAFAGLSYEDLMARLSDGATQADIKEAIIENGLDMDVNRALLRKLDRADAPEWLIDMLIDYDENEYGYTRRGGNVGSAGYASQQPHSIHYGPCNCGRYGSYLWYGSPYVSWLYFNDWYYQRGFGGFGHYGYGYPYYYNYYDYSGNGYPSRPDRGTVLGHARPRGSSGSGRTEATRSSSGKPRGKVTRTGRSSGRTKARTSSRSSGRTRAASPRSSGSSSRASSPRSSSSSRSSSGSRGGRSRN